MIREYREILSPAMPRGYPLFQGRQADRQGNLLFLKDVVPKDGVGGYGSPFLGAELAAGHIELGRQAHHPDLMEQGGASQLDEPVVRQLERSPDHYGKHGRAGGMGYQVVRMRLDQRLYPEDELAVFRDDLAEGFNTNGNLRQHQFVFGDIPVVHGFHECGELFVETLDLLQPFAVSRIDRNNGIPVFSGCFSLHVHIRYDLLWNALGIDLPESPFNQVIDQVPGYGGFGGQKDIILIQKDRFGEIGIRLKVLDGYLVHGPH